jgi:hypothetical protein
MLSKNPETGSVSEITSMLRAAMAEHGYRIEKRDDFVTLVVGDDSALRDAMAAWEAAWDAKPFQSPRDRQEDYCRNQLSGFASYGNKAGCGWDYSISTNIYGWACGSHFRSNVQGGRFAATARGATLEDCYRYGLARVAEGRNQTLRLTLSHSRFGANAMPDEVLAAVGLTRDGERA